jgi:flagellar hook assembly protein FlgD
LAAGSYDFTATFNGSSRLLGSTSSVQTMPVIVDTVHATGVTTSETTFYPVKDSYKDTVTIKGNRQESIGVTIKIYTPAGSLIKTVSIASGTGAYSYAWNGRKADGTIRAEGKYKITQTLKDAAGNSRTFTFYVNLSKKKLYTYTTTVTRKGSTAAAGGSDGTGSITISTTAGTAVVRSGSAGWSGVGYDFTLPSATVYKSIKFRVYAKNRLAPYNVIGMQNFSVCPYSATADWDEGCFDHWDSAGNGTNTVAYFTTTGSVNLNRSGTHARGMLSVSNGTVTVYKAQIVLVYGVLKY